ncbi:MAG: hypothetical protein ACYC5O_13930 [Anaerolineae bacterium]
MSGPNLKPANLDDRALGKLRQLEEHLGKTVVAYDSGPREFAHLSIEQTRRLQEAERELGVTLIAYDETD